MLVLVEDWFWQKIHRNLVVCFHQKLYKTKMKH